MEQSFKAILEMILILVFVAEKRKTASNRKQSLLFFKIFIQASILASEKLRSSI
ncbi:hypothetical protein [Chryseobacterium cucumeris]|uniref:hypothetical protein n=1 Tax=Chryseobacterium cucumeris TaxID=1813611 RepID=UPI00192DAEE2|nr:hypothetical protein [Chryseobacterium cucumeris]QRA45228.1 hypothetical protein JNG87_10915 [Chryseobacterium cucumeris]